MKKILAMVCVFALMLSMTAFGVSADDKTYYGDLEYEVKDGIAVITGIKEYHSSSDIVIPATIDEYPVKAIAAFAFKNISTVYTVEIPDSVVEIGGQAFYNCDGLESIVIPDSVTKIGSGNGDGLFEGCDSLESATIGAGLKEIPDYMFKNCTKLESVTLSENVKSIGIEAFYKCTKLAEIDFKNVNAIGSEAFYGCSRIQELSFPAENTVIGSRAFYNCDSLAKLDLNNVVTIGASAFYDCDAIKELLIPESVSVLEESYIDGGVFKSNKALKELVIFGSMTTIPDGAFGYCKDLEKIYIDKGNLTKINDGAFDDCSNVKDVYFSGTEAEWKEISGDSAFNDWNQKNINFHFEATYDEHLFDEVVEPTEPETTVPETTAPETTVTEPSEIVTTVPVVEDKGLLGDVNGDEKVNIKDATEIQKYAAKLTDLDADAQLRADVNTDEKINVKDATAIQKYVAKIETGLAIGETIR